MAAVATTKKANGAATTAKKRLERTEGLHRLSRLGLTNKRIAEEIEVEPSTVGRWFALETRPTARQRDRIHARYGIEPELFDEPRKETMAAAVDPKKSPAELFREILADRLKALHGQCGKADVLPRDVDMMRTVKGMLEDVEKNATPEEQRARILRSAEWAKLKRAILDALAPHPDAAAAVAEAIENVFSTP